MPKYAIVVTYNTDDYWWISDGWKDQVCEDFDENVVIIGDGYNSGSIEEASWWKDAKSLSSSLADELWNSDFGEYMDYHHGECADDKLREIYDFFHSNDYATDDTDFIMKVAIILYPFLKLEQDRISGYHTWSDVIYVRDSIDIDILHDWYYGEIFVVDAYELDMESIEEDEVDINDMTISEVRDYGESIGEDYAIESTYYYKKYFRLSDKEKLEQFASDLGLNPEDCVLVED